LSGDAPKSEKHSVTRTDLTRAALRGLFLESSWNDDGQQNLGRAVVLYPIARKLLLKASLEGQAALRGEPDSSGQDPSGQDPSSQNPSSPDPATLKALSPDSPGPTDLEGAERELALRLLKPFNTNPVTAGLVLGATIRFEERRAYSTEEFTASQDSLLSSLASVSSAQGDQIFWNTWLPFCSLSAFFLTHFTGSYLTPFLLPLLFCVLAFPVRFGSFFLGYSKGKEVCSQKFLIHALAFRKKFHAAIFFLSGVFTVLLLYRLPLLVGTLSPEAELGTNLASNQRADYLGALSPSPKVWIYAALVFLILYATIGIKKRCRFMSAPLYLLDALLFYLIFLIL
jgi:mannose/fructose/N-acetylgalactosamine-specific phosphotransferase system component IID